MPKGPLMTAYEQGIVEQIFNREKYDRNHRTRHGEDWLCPDCRRCNYYNGERPDGRCTRAATRQDDDAEARWWCEQEDHGA